MNIANPSRSQGWCLMVLVQAPTGRHATKVWGLTILVSLRRRSYTALFLLLRLRTIMVPLVQLELPTTTGRAKLLRSSVALSIGSELEDTHICTELITPLDCSLFLTEIGLEVSSVVINLLSSPEKPHYALAGMLCANVAMLLSILELIYEGIRKRELLASQNTVRSIIMMLPEITGFGLATFQSISSVVQFYSRHEHNQLNIYLGGVYACFCLFLFKFGRKLRNQ